MKKRGTKKKLFAISIIFILLFSVLIVAATTGLGKLKVKIDSTISEKITPALTKLVELEGIDAGSITSVDKVNFENVPSEINIQDVQDSNFGFYQIGLDQPEKPNLFVVSFLPGGLTKPTGIGTTPSQSTTPIPQRIPDLLEFASSKEITSSGFLENTDGTTGGYSMIVDGNIKKMSTYLEIYQESEGKSVSITLYKNGAPTSISDSFIVDPNKLILSPGVRSYFVYDFETKGNVDFKKDDVISVYVTLSDGVTLKSVTNSVPLK
jgi:hypothetical protein